MRLITYLIAAALLWALSTSGPPTGAEAAPRPAAEKAAPRPAPAHVR